MLVEGELPRVSDFLAELDTLTPKSPKIDSSSARFTTLKTHCSRTQLSLVFRSQDVIHLKFSVSEALVCSKHRNKLRANAELSVSLFGSPGKRNTCGLA